MGDGYSDCRSAEGITIGLIDGILLNAQLLVGRDLTTNDVVSDALCELADHPELMSLLEAARAQKAKVAAESTVREERLEAFYDLAYRLGFV